MLRSVLLAALMVLATKVQSSPIASELSGAEVRGVATFRYLGFPLYEARLFTQSGVPLDWNAEFALELRYLRNLSERDLVESTMREFTRTGRQLPLRGQLAQCFDDVSKGDRYTAVTNGPNRLGFWLNDTAKCTLSHPDIKSRFMGIFLGENTRSRAFTRALKGE